MAGLAPAIHSLLDVSDRNYGYYAGRATQQTDHPISRSTASTALRSSAVRAACGATGSPTS